MSSGGLSLLVQRQFRNRPSSCCVSWILGAERLPFKNMERIPVPTAIAATTPTTKPRFEDPKSAELLLLTPKHANNNIRNDATAHQQWHGYSETDQPRIEDSYQQGHYRCTCSAYCLREPPPPQSITSTGCICSVVAEKKTLAIIACPSRS